MSVKFPGITKTETEVGRDPLERAIHTSGGRVQPHARIYLGNTDVDDLAGLDTPVQGSDQMVLASLAPLCDS